MVATTIAILTVIIILVVILELAKHQISKMIVMTILIGTIGLFILLFVTSNLALEGQIDSDNEFIATGASVLKTIKESPLAEDMKESMEKLKDKVLGKDDF